MINRMLASDMIMLIGCCTVLLMLVADFIYTEYLYRKHHKDEYILPKRQSRKRR
jgi:hypothetical protein